MGKKYLYQYVCFDIRNKEAIDLANKKLLELGQEGYDLYYSITENRKEGSLSDIRLNKLRKQL